MVNESLVALSIVAASASSSDSSSPSSNAMSEEDVHRHLHTDLVINGARRVILAPVPSPEEGSPRKGAMPAEVRRNALTMVAQLMRSKEGEFAQMLVDLEFPQALEKVCLDFHALSFNKSSFVRFKVYYSTPIPFLVVDQIFILAFFQVLGEDKDATLGSDGAKEAEALLEKIRKAKT